MLVSSPAAHPKERKALFTFTRVDLEKNRYVTYIAVAHLDSGSVEEVTRGGPDSCPRWRPGGEAITFISRRGFREGERGSSLYIVVPGRSLEPVEIARFPQGITAYEWAPTGELIAVVERIAEDEDVKRVERIPVWFNGEGFVYNRCRHLALLDPRSGEVRRLTEGCPDVVSFAWSPDSRRIAFLATDRDRPPLTRLYMASVEGGVEEVELPRPLMGVDLVWSPEGRHLAIIARPLDTPRGFAANNRVWLLDLGSGEFECLTCTLDRNVVNTVGSDSRGGHCSRAIAWSARYGITFLVSDGGRTKLFSVLPNREPRALLELEGMSVDEFSVPPSGSYIAFTAMSSTRPNELYAYLGRGVVKQVTYMNRWLERYEITKPKHFRFTASDGTVIDGWALLPPRMSEGSKVPWVLYIHGGPKMMFGEGFMFEFHLLAAKGFAVAYCNPRGSDGYGEEFADIRCRYGERDFQDIMECVDHAVKNFDFLDPERVGVAGGSYGGFMTNWIITHTDRFRAAITQRSISYWVSKYGTTDIGFYFNADMIGRGEPPWRNPGAYIEKSPLIRADKARTPTLIIHSMEDYRCWLDQALLFFTALKVSGVETRLVIFPGESHDLSRSGKPKHRVERLREIVTWFEKHLKR